MKKNLLILGKRTRKVCQETAKNKKLFPDTVHLILVNH